MIDGILKSPLTIDQVIPVSSSWSHLGTIDEWSSMEDFTLKALLERKRSSDVKHLFRQFTQTLSLHL